MADVSKVHGPSGPPENVGKKDKSPVDADKFKETMRKRVTEVSKIDPDEKKKRKQSKEAEEEDAAPQTGPTTPPDLVTPFSMEKEAQKAGPMDMQKGTSSISPTDSAQPMKPMHLSSQKTAFFRPPPIEEMEDGSSPPEEQEPFKSGPPVSPQPSNQGAPSTPTENWTPEGQQPLKAGPPETSQKKSDTQHVEEKRKVGPPKSSRGTTSTDIEQTQASKEQETTAFFEQLGKKEKEQKKELKEKPLKEQEAIGPPPGAGIPPQAPSFGQIPEKESEKKIEKPNEAEAELLPMAAPPTPVPPPAPETLPPYANLPPQVQQLFDRMVGVMTVMNMSGMTETVITLNTPQFASSVFFGTQIIIQEFSTAPQAFNIELKGDPQAVALFQGNANDLMAAFQAGNYNFRINRFETGYLSDRPLFKRKEKASGDQHEHTGDNPQ